MTGTLQTDLLGAISGIPINDFQNRLFIFPELLHMSPEVLGGNVPPPLHANLKKFPSTCLCLLVEVCVGDLNLLRRKKKR